MKSNAATESLTCALAQHLPAASGANGVSTMPSPPPPPPQRLQPGNLPASGMQVPVELVRSGSSSSIDGAVMRNPPPQHSWSHCPAAAFKVRCGPNYKASGKKAPSADAIYEVRALARGVLQCSLLRCACARVRRLRPQVYAVDVYQSPTKLPHIGRVASLPAHPEPLPSDAGLPPHVIINWMVPNYAPGGLLGSKKTNGPGWNLVLYCRLSTSVCAMLREGTSAQLPALDVLRRYMSPANGSVLRGTRLKCVFGLIDKEGPAFGMVLKQMISRYNFKPFLSKTASFCYCGPVRCNRHSAAGRRCRRHHGPYHRHSSLCPCHCCCFRGRHDHCWAAAPPLFRRRHRSCFVAGTAAASSPAPPTCHSRLCVSGPATGC